MSNIALFSFLLSLTLSTYPVFASDEDSVVFHTVQPKWEVGDAFSYQRVKINNFYFNDSLINEEQTVDLFHLKIEETVSHNIVQFYNDEANFKKNKAPEGVDTEKLLLFKLIEDLSYQMFQFPYRIQLSDSVLTHEPVVINLSDYNTHLKAKTEATFDRYKEVLNKSEDELNALKKYAIEYMEQEEKRVREALLEDFKALFFGYSVSISTEATHKREFETKKIALFSEQPFQPIKATEEAAFDEVEKESNINIERYYDKADFLSKIKLVQPVFSNVKADDLTLIERTQITFEKPANWLTNQTSEAIALLPGVKVVQVTTIQRLVN